MKTLELDAYAKLKTELSKLQKENYALLSRNNDLEQRLNELHGEYLLLRYKLQELPSPAEFLKLRQEIQYLKKELRDLGWKDLM